MPVFPPDDDDAVVTNRAVDAKRGGDARLFTGNDQLDAGILGVGIGAVGALVVGEIIKSEENKNRCRYRRDDGTQARFLGLGGKKDTYCPPAPYHPPGYAQPPVAHPAGYAPPAHYPPGYAAPPAHHHPAGYQPPAYPQPAPMYPHPAPAPAYQQRPPHQVNYQAPGYYPPQPQYPAAGYKQPATPVYYPTPAPYRPTAAPYKPTYRPAYNNPSSSYNRPGSSYNRPETHIPVNNYRPGYPYNRSSEDLSDLSPRSRVAGKKGFGAPGEEGEEDKTNHGKDDAEEETKGTEIKIKPSDRVRFGA